MLLHFSEVNYSIINTTSTLAFQRTKTLVDYAAAMRVIASFTRSLAQQLLPKAIHVNAVAAGPVYTPLQASRPAKQMKGYGQPGNTKDLVGVENE